MMLIPTEMREEDRRLLSEQMAREEDEAAMQEWEADPLSALAERYSEGDW